MSDLRSRFYQQLDMFEEKAVARSGDPDTSWQAAQIASHGIRFNQWLVWKTLMDHGPMTDEEIYEALPGIPIIDTAFGQPVGERKPMTDSGCRTRRNELREKGLVRWTGQKGLTEAGNPSRIWQAVGLQGGGHLNWRSMLPHFARRITKRGTMRGSPYEHEVLDLEDVQNIVSFGIQFFYYPILPHVGRHNLKGWLPKISLNREKSHISQEFLEEAPFEGRRYRLDIWWIFFQLQLFIQMEGPWTR